MTPKEALEYSKKALFDFEKYRDRVLFHNGHYISAEPYMNLVVAALEKQTPKKLGENFSCPSCGEIVGDGLFCEWCGQALDLSEDKE